MLHKYSERREEGALAFFFFFSMVIFKILELIFQ